ncbi:MAG: polyribonucleotide nucleotidyltransferase [Candidatus Margulisiibacteriota bacterium]
MLNNPKTSKQTIFNRDVTLTTGVMAKQANGSVVLQCGDLVLLATATMSKNPKEGIDFFPLTIEYAEKMYASGKIPGGFFKREARPSTTAVLTSRLIDRPLRPLFPKGFHHEVQVVITTLSYDETLSPEAFGIVAASAALSVSDIPFAGPVGGVLVGYIDGQYQINPSYADMERSELHLVVAGTKDAILMVEAGAKEVSEDIMLKGITFGHEHIKAFVALQESLAAQAGKTKVVLPEKVVNTELFSKLDAFLSEIETQFQSGNKQQISDALDTIEKRALEAFVAEDESNKAEVASLISKIKKEKIRKVIITKKVRPDGRALTEIRPIEIQAGLLPSTHGSALFTRGETQSLGVVTLGTADDEQIEDGMQHDTPNKTYYFHYNFPPFSVGEVGRMGTGRREQGHGALAERALKPILPDAQAFPYTLRIVSEIFESNGSSSMASVCSGSLALMDCGVPIKAAVSGIAMGLLISEDGYVILSDIQGLEDHYGDMDFKVAGTQNGITALQLDIKVSGLSEEILKNALFQARDGRFHILHEMNQVLDTPRGVLSANAPKIETLTINPEKVGLLIGPGGKMIRKIEEDTKATVIVTDGSTGLVSVSAKNTEALEAAKRTILNLVRDVEVGDEFDGKVNRITHFGAFVELLPGKDGLMHISSLSKKRVEKVEDVLSLGQVVKVRVKEIDAQNRINIVPVTPFEI